MPGYPQRPVPRNEDAAKALKKRTLTTLYNARPQWLADAHAALDAAVTAEYGCYRNGFCHSIPSKRAKSPSVEHSTRPCSIANAAR